MLTLLEIDGQLFHAQDIYDGVIMKITVLLIALFLSGCESNLETTLREQKECKQVGGEPITNQITISNFRGEKLGSGFTVICRFKESQ